MAKEVILTPLAIINYEDIVDYLMLNWGTTVTSNFIARFENLCELLSENPAIFPFINRSKQVQKCVLTKHNILTLKNMLILLKYLQFLIPVRLPKN